MLQVFSPVAVFKDDGQIECWLLIECTASGFQAVNWSNRGDGADRRNNLTSAGVSLSTATTAFDKRLAMLERSGITRIERGLVPSEYNPDVAAEMTREAAQQWNDEVFGSLRVPNAADPRKIKAATLAATKEERDRRALVEGLAIALQDSEAIWTEFSNLQFLTISKAGGSFAVTRVGSANPLNHDASVVAKRIAQEIGGSFEIIGYLAEDNSFVVIRPVTNPWEPDVLMRLSRARASIVRRARHFSSRDERIAGLRDVMRGRANAVHVKCARPEAYRYADQRIALPDLQAVMASLPVDLREALTS